MHQRNRFVPLVPHKLARYAGVKFEGAIEIIPNLPTDNLYKFMALSGLLIAVLAIYLLDKNVTSISEELHTVEVSSKEYEVKVQFLDNKVQILRAAVDNSIRQQNQEYDRDKSKLEIGMSEKEIKNLINEADEIALNIQLDSVRREAALDRIYELNEELRERARWSYFFIFLGVILAGSGFWLWYVRVQKPLDLNLNSGG